MTPPFEEALLLVVALPAFVALSLIAIGAIQSFAGAAPLPERVWREVGIGTGVATFALALVGLALRFDPEVLGPQFLTAVGGSLASGPRIVLGLDGIGLCFLLSTTGLVPIALISTRGEPIESVRSFIFVVLMLESSLLGALTAYDLYGFLYFWAQSLPPILVWLGRWGGEGRARVATRVWSTESIGLAGLLFVVFAVAEASEARLGLQGLELVPVAAPGLASIGIDTTTAGLAGTAAGNGAATILDLRFSLAEQRLLFCVLVVALMTRLPIVPLHFWLPAAHAASPTGLSVLLATGFAQTAAIGLLRFALPLFPDAAREAQTLLAVVGIIALGHASLVALVQKELNRLIAYLAIGHAGFALFGIATLNVQGMTGAVVQLLAHGLATSGLFVLIGALGRRRGTTEVAAFGGLARPMPVCAAFFGLMVFSSMGFPLLGGFIGDLFVLLGSLDLRRELSIVALAAMGIAAAYLLWLQRRVFFGPIEEPANRGLIDLDRSERAVLFALALPILAIGVYPNPLLRRVEPAVLEILHQMGRPRAVAAEGSSDVPVGPPVVRVPASATEVPSASDAQSGAAG